MSRTDRAIRAAPFASDLDFNVGSVFESFHKDGSGVGLEALREIRSESLTWLADDPTLSQQALS
ncbi:hypothetical protein [Streptomyces sp. NPDC058664]|uniref:hypothetical protein n=1 Tax=unclassified Streptomyces TaxID=2593676 RepID=UPI003663D6D8